MTQHQSTDKPLTDMHEAMSALMEAFFGKDTIVATMNILFTDYVDSVSDVLTTIPSMLLQHALHACFTDLGFSPIEKNPTIVILYSKMTYAQLQVIQQVCRLMRKMESYHGCTQMGGGLYVYQRCPREDFYVSPTLILYACNVILSRRSSKKRVLSAVHKTELMNIITQRLICNNLINQQQIMQARRLLVEGGVCGGE